MTLYILKAIPSGLIKIGISDQFDRRLSAIRWQCEWFYGGSEVDCVVSRLDRDFSFMKVEDAPAPTGV
jgi:hypothetical protein